MKMRIKQPSVPSCLVISCLLFLLSSCSSSSSIRSVHAAAAVPEKDPDNNHHHHHILNTNLSLLRQRQLTTTSNDDDDNNNNNNNNNTNNNNNNSSNIFSHNAENTTTNTTITPTIDTETRIVGGRYALMGEYPAYGISSGSTLCGAVLIHSDILMTAAHCSGTFLQNGGLLYLGTNYLTGQGSAAVQRLYVEREIPHPNHSFRTNENDVMLLKVKSAAASSVTPMKYNTNANIPVNDASTTVIGFGRTSENGRASPQLLKANVDVVDYQTCNSVYSGSSSSSWNSRVFDNVMICAGGDGKDSCQGDSGGPLILDDGSSSNVVVGLVSWGAGCGRRGIPGVYTRVSGVADFIQQGICDYSNNPPESCNTNDNNNNGGGNANNNDPPEVVVPPPPSSTPPPTTCSNYGSCNWWIFGGYVVHEKTSTECVEKCIIWFLEAYLAEGYRCGGC